MLLALEQRTIILVVLCVYLLCIWCVSADRKVGTTDQQKREKIGGRTHFEVSVSVWTSNTEILQKSMCASKMDCVHRTGISLVSLLWCGHAFPLISCAGFRFAVACHIFLRGSPDRVTFPGTYLNLRGLFWYGSVTYFPESTSATENRVGCFRRIFEYLRIQSATKSKTTAVSSASKGWIAFCSSPSVLVAKTFCLHSVYRHHVGTRRFEHSNSSS